MACKDYEEMVERLWLNEVSEAEQARWETHCASCAGCRQDWQQYQRSVALLQEGLASAQVPQAARLAFAQRVAEEKVYPLRVPPLRLGSKYWAVAAVLLWLLTLPLVFYLGRVSHRESNTTQAEVVAMTVRDLEGTVLVRHEAESVWQPLLPDAAIAVGDSFHVMGKGALVLGLDMIDEVSTFTLSPHATVRLTACAEQIEFYVEQGTAAATLESPHGPFFVRTPHGRVEALGTEFIVQVE